MTSDYELLQRFVEHRSESDFSELVGRHLGLVYHAALRRTGGRNDLAQDVTQYVFTTLARQAADLVRHEALAGWLYTTTRYAANRTMRAERRRELREQEAAVMNELVSPDSAAEWHQLRQELDGVMDELSEQDREAILLRFFHDQTFSRIGAASGSSEDAARKRVERALERLRQLLLNRGITSTSAALSGVLSSEAALPVPAGMAQSVANLAVLQMTGMSLPATIGGQLMSMKTTLGIAGILGIAAIGIATYEVRSSQHAESALAAIQRAADEQESRLKALRQEAQISEAHLADTRAEWERAARVATTTKQAVTENPPAPAGPQTRNPRADGERFLAQYGQARGILEEIGRSQITRMNSFFYRLAGLTPAQVQEFEDRTMDYFLRHTIAMPPGSITSSVLSLPEDQIREIAGEEAVEKFQEYKRINSGYGVALQVATAAGLAGSPLLGGQSDQLVRTIVDNCSSYQAGGKLDAAAVEWSTVIGQAKTFLSPEQWQASEPVLLNLLFQQNVTKAQREVLANASKNKP